MSDDAKGLGETAKSLARNPLGIIALFIVLVYGFASLVTAFAGSFTTAERLPLIYFLIGFPVLVLGVFAWLVSKHSGKLFAPSDFKDEENYVKMQMGQSGTQLRCVSLPLWRDGPSLDATGIRARPASDLFRFSSIHSVGGPRSSRSL